MYRGRNQSVHFNVDIVFATVSLTDHLHKKSDPIRAFLDERLVDFTPAKSNWKAAQAGKPLADHAVDWHVVGMAIDQRIRMMLAPVRFEVPPNRPHDVLTSAIPSVLSVLEDVQSRHDGALGEIPADDEKRLLQVCYVLSMYTAYARSSYSSQRNSPLSTLQRGAGWRAHMNRVPDGDIEVLQKLVEPALALFPHFAGKRGVVVGPIFEDSLLVDGADGDLVINGNLIEIKCETPGFSGRTVLQLIAYSLLDSSGRYEFEKCSVYLARYGSLAAWNLDDLITEVSQGHYSYKSLRDEFHSWLVSRDELRRAKREALEESQRRFAGKWRLISDAGKEAWEARLDFNEEAQLTATIKLAKAISELHRLEDEAGLGIHREDDSATEFAEDA
jgi:hypothetical protein